MDPVPVDSAVEARRDAQEAEAAVQRAAAKVDELDAQVREELDKERKEQVVAAAIEMCRKKARAAQAEVAKAQARRRAAKEEEEDDEEDEESEPDAKKQKRAPKKDLLAMYGSHEKVLTHYMQLSNGFVLEDREAEVEHPVQLVVPKCGAEKMKSFRARFGRHLRALGFVLNTSEEAERQERLLKPAYLEYAKKFDSNVWVRPYATDPKRAFAQRKLDAHTLLEVPPPGAMDPALLEDPLADA